MLSRQAAGSALLGSRRPPSLSRRSDSVRLSAASPSSTEDAAATLPAPPTASSSAIHPTAAAIGGAPVSTVSTSIVPSRGLRRSLSMASLIRPVEGASSRETLDQVISHVSLPAPQLAAIARSMASSMAAGLASCSKQKEDGGSGEPQLLMLPTATDSLPDGHERGEYFALDFGGGPTLRLLFVRFSDDRRHETSALDLEEVEVPPRLRTAHADELFDFLAASALEFVRRVGWDGEKKGPPVFGFCFSFPISQDPSEGHGHGGGAARGTLVRWAKGYSCEGGVGCEPSACLEAAARRVAAAAAAAAAREQQQQGEGEGGGAAALGIGAPSPPPLVVAALANDTVATLAAARYEDGGDAAMSLVLHRGTNAAYVESLANVAKQCDAVALRARGWSPRSPEVVVDVEWPAFDDALLPALPDDDVGGGTRGGRGGGEIAGGEEEAPRVFEALTAPMCLGEAARRLLVRLGDAGGWFYDPSSSLGEGSDGGDTNDDESGRGKASAPPLWREPGALDAVAVARAAADCSPDARFAAEELAAAFSPGGDSCPSSQRADFLRFLHNNRDARVQCRDACAALLRRSARLTAAGVAGVLLHREETTSGAFSSSSSVSSPMAPCSPLPAAAAEAASLPSALQRRTIVAVEGAMLRRGGPFVDELRRALSETLEATFRGPSSSSSPPPVVSLTVPDGGSALGVAALAAAADNAARAMGQQDLGRQATTEGEFLRFPPRRGAPRAP